MIQRVIKPGSSTSGMSRPQHWNRREAEEMAFARFYRCGKQQQMEELAVGKKLYHRHWPNFSWMEHGGEGHGQKLSYSLLCNASLFGRMCLKGVCCRCVREREHTLSTLCTHGQYEHSGSRSTTPWHRCMTLFNVDEAVLSTPSRNSEGPFIQQMVKSTGWLLPEH